MLMLLSTLALQHRLEAKNATKEANSFTWQLKLRSPFTRFINSIRRVKRIRPPKIWLSGQNSVDALRSLTK